VSCALVDEEARSPFILLFPMACHVIVCKKFADASLPKRPSLAQGDQPQAPETASRQ